MQLSKYNIVKDVEDGNLLIFNTISSGVLLLDDENAKLYRALVNSNIFNDNDLINQLKKGEMIIEDGIDELHNLKLFSRVNQYGAQGLNMTIAPTTYCNFRCSYCYETGANHDNMPKEVEDKILELVVNKTTSSSELRVSWYGGEPLLRFDVIKRLSKEFLNLIESGSLNIYQANIITNGYLLSENMAQELQELHITDVQITLDGNEESHNKRRVHETDSSTYKKLIENIVKASSHVKITIRVNIDSSNCNTATRLIEDLESHNLQGKVSLYIAPVENINNIMEDDTCLSMADFSKYELHFLKESAKKGFNVVSMPLHKYNYCGATNINTVVIGPNGDYYKCWNDIGRPEFSIGNVYEGIKSYTNVNSWLLYDQYADKDCISCKLLPICMGGCPYQRIRVGRKKCRPIKFNYDGMLDLLLHTNIN